MAHRVTLIPGDGIGPEVSDAARRVIESRAMAAVIRASWLGGRRGAGR